MAAAVLLLLALFSSSSSVAAQQQQYAGRIVVSHDEWFANKVNRLDPLSTPGNSEEFITNIANWFGRDRSYLMASRGGQESKLPDLMDYARIQLNVDWTVLIRSTDWENLGDYDAVFVSGRPLFYEDVGAADKLRDYVLHGGNVVLAGGTAADVAGEAAFWSSFLNPFGLQFLPSFNSFVGVVPTVPFRTQGPVGAALFTDVNGLFADRGNSIELGPRDVPQGVTVQLFRDPSPAQQGIYAVVQVVPEPATFVLVGSGLGLLIGLHRRRRARSDEHR